MKYARRLVHACLIAGILIQTCPARAAFEAAVLSPRLSRSWPAYQKLFIENCRSQIVRILGDEFKISLATVYNLKRVRPANTFDSTRIAELSGQLMQREPESLNPLITKIEADVFRRRIESGEEILNETGEHVISRVWVFADQDNEVQGYIYVRCAPEKGVWKTYIAETAVDWGMRDKQVGEALFLKMMQGIVLEFAGKTNEFIFYGHSANPKIYAENGLAVKLGFSVTRSDDFFYEFTREFYLERSFQSFTDALQMSSPKVQKEMVADLLKEIGSHISRGYFSEALLDFSSWHRYGNGLEYYGDMELNLSEVTAASISERLRDRIIREVGPNRQLLSRVDELVFGKTREGFELLEDEITYGKYYPAYRDAVIRALGPVQRVLVIGCGLNGKLETRLRDQGVYVVGVDLRLGSMDNPGLDRFVPGDAHRLAELPGMKEEAAFDAVMFAESIGYMDIPRVLEQAVRMLKPKGKILITTYPPRSGHSNSVYKRFSDRYWKDIKVRGFLPEVQDHFFLSLGNFTLPGHVQFVTLTETAKDKIPQIRSPGLPKGIASAI